MVPHTPGDVPAAFRHRPSFLGLTDEQVLGLARSALRRRDWPRFDEAMEELRARVARHVLAKLRERGQS